METEEVNYIIEEGKKLTHEQIADIAWVLMNAHEKVSDTALEDILLPMLSIMPVTLQSVTMSSLFRARFGKFHLIEELCHAPNNSVLNYGRMNVPGISVHYASTSADGACVEIRANIGDIVTILETEVKQVDVVEFGFNFSSIIGSHPEHVLQAIKTRKTFLNTYPNIDEQIKLDLIMTFFNRLCINPGNSHVYRITGIASNLIAGWLGHHFDGFMYPAVMSIESNLAIGITDANFALSPHCIKTKGIHKSIAVLKVVQKNGNRITLETLEKTVFNQAK